MTLSFAQTMADQDDLTALCADRPERTSERFAGNDYYGSASVLKEYAELPQGEPLSVVVPHGPSLNDHVWHCELQGDARLILCYSPYRQKVYRKLGKRTALCAAPFLYAMKMVEGQPRERKGTVFFPGHSTHHVTAHQQLNRIADRLASFSDEYQPVTVFAYWRDYNLGHRQVFIDRGFRVVSTGHMYDHNFLYRLYHLCSTHKYACSNEVGTHILYAAAAGCSYFHMPDFACQHKADASVLARDGSREEDYQEVARRLGPVLSRSPSCSQDRLAIVDYYIGRLFLYSPEKLRWVLAEHEGT